MILKCLLRNSRIKGIIYVKNDKGKRDDRPSRRSEGTDPILIRQEDKSYCDLLKTEKEVVKDQRGVTDGIKTIRKTLEDKSMQGIQNCVLRPTMVIAANIPIYLLTEERRRLWLLGEYPEAQKREERAKTIRTWQEEWDGSTELQDFPECGQIDTVEHVV